jgi:hypothetical protein
MTGDVDDNLEMAVKHENHEEMADLIESKPNLDHSLILSVDTQGSVRRVATTRRLFSSAEWMIPTARSLQGICP